jgi:4-hydroxymandelate oxidase
MLQKVVRLEELEALARSGMSRSVVAYASRLAGDELTTRSNAESWTRIRLSPKILRDVSEIDIQTKILDHLFDIPILLAPTAMNRLWHEKAEMAVVKGANESRVTLVTSAYATESVEEVCRIATQPVWFQLYNDHADRTFTKQLIERAEQAGCKAIVITIDIAAIGIQDSEERGYLRIPPNVHLPNLNIDGTHLRSRHNGFGLLPDSKLTWKELEWLCSVAKTAVWLKGVLSPKDAMRALDAGVAGVIVSNHGARHLDSLPTTADALPRIVDELQGRVPIMVDGGIRRGTDILKALALGAKAVLIGQPYLHGLAVGGAAGVARIIDILRFEFKSAMAQAGCATINEIDQSILWES